MTLGSCAAPKGRFEVEQIVAQEQNIAPVDLIHTSRCIVFIAHKGNAHRETLGASYCVFTKDAFWVRSVDGKDTKYFIPRAKMLSSALYETKNYSQAQIRTDSIVLGMHSGADAKDYQITPARTLFDALVKMGIPVVDARYPVPGPEMPVLFVY